MSSEGKSLRHSLAALSRWANTDPDERSRHMAELSRLSAEKRAADRDARGEAPTRKRRPRSTDPLPPIADLLPIMDAIQRERADAGLTELAVEPLMREAALRVRRALAADTYKALKGDS